MLTHQFSQTGHFAPPGPDEARSQNHSLESGLHHNEQFQHTSAMFGDNHGGSWELQTVPVEFPLITPLPADRLVILA